MNNTTNNDILVTIFCRAYNFGEYITDAIEGFLMQKCNFKYEIVIFDDASTDGSADIIRKYSHKYPDLFVTHLQQTNTYNHPDRHKMDIQLFESFRGKYVAFCEGDDYWTDPNKLQIQVDYMEAHPDCTLTMHNAIRKNYSTGKESLMQLKIPTGNLGAKEVIALSDHMYPTASMVLKKEILFREAFFYKTKTGDIPLQLNAFSKGTVHYFNIPMSVYRYKHDNSWSIKNKGGDRNYIMHNLRMLEFLDEYDNYTETKYHNHIITAIQKRYTYTCAHFECDLKDFIYECNQIDAETGYVYHKYLENLIERYKITTDTHYIPSKCLDFLNSNKDILVMGAGENAESLIPRLECSGYSVKGIIVSNGHKSYETFLGLPVKEIREIKNINDYAVIISISATLYYEIYDILKENKIINYYYFHLL